MTCYKIIQDNKVTDVGCAFLKWNPERKKLYICNVDEGQFIQSYLNGTIFTTTWLKPAPKGAGSYPVVEAVVITEQEFEDLLKILKEGESVEETIPPEVIPVQEHEIPEEEKPMSIPEMREIIKKQQEQINLLLEQYNKS